LKYVSDSVLRLLPENELPVRFAVTKTDESQHYCEIGVLSNLAQSFGKPRDYIFNFERRAFENTNQFNAVLLVPTGIGAEIGGHAGDAGPVARLLAGVCDHLITHPNVVNASDINELPENGLYVEGSILTRLLMGTIGLQKVRSNRVILIIDKHKDKFFDEAAVNAASAARATLGFNCPLVIKMGETIDTKAFYTRSGRAVGKVDYFERLLDVLERYRNDYDAVALSTIIGVPLESHERYLLEDIINPWGGVEAMLSHAVSLLYDVPSAHAPMLEARELLYLDAGEVDPRKAAEAVSATFLHCVLKGLHKSPRIIPTSMTDQVGGISARDISCLVIPYGCVGLPTLAAIEQGIPVIAVKENKNRMQNKLESLPFENRKLFVVNNYLEAVGVMQALKAGVSVESVRRPLQYTNVQEEVGRDKCEKERQTSERTAMILDEDHASVL